MRTGGGHDCPEVRGIHPLELREKKASKKQLSRGERRIGKYASRGYAEEKGEHDLMVWAV